MRILHTADLHIGQVIYQNYGRGDEHRHFFSQLRRWCEELRPDALIVSGDVFDIQQPSAATKRAFNDYVVELHRACPDVAIVVTAGNHDSASRLEADGAIWDLGGIRMVGLAPQSEPAEGWEERYIVRLPAGYVVAMPFMPGERREVLQHLMDVVARENTEGLPVVMTAHTAVTGLDLTGHDMEIGRLKTQDADAFGTGFDYLALGHIHKPQTLGHQEDALREEVCYPAPVMRYSGSALHVSCDEAYPHSVSLVDIDGHGGEVRVRQLRIDELRHFYVLPEDGSSCKSAEEALEEVRRFCRERGRGYIRLRADIGTDLPSNFNQMVYDLLAATGDEVRYNPKVVWTGEEAGPGCESERPTFEVAELQQMTDPMDFVERTIDQYPTLTMEEVREAFEEVEREIVRMKEEDDQKARTKAEKKNAKKQTDQ